MKTTDSTKLVQASIEVILANQAETGAYIASPSFRVYNYSWYRDGAFIADSMLEVGEIESALKFHLWAANVINSRSAKINSLVQLKSEKVAIPEHQHLHCRYTVQGEEGLESWTNFQLDGFGTWLWAVSRFCSQTNISDPRIDSAMRTISLYLVSFWETPSYDWWEESHGHLHVSSIGAIAAGLKAAASTRLLEDNLNLQLLETSESIKDVIFKRGINKSGSLRKWLDEDGLDASTSSLISPLGVFDPRSDVAQKTVSEIGVSLGKLGTHRHLNDVYYGGGPWPLLSGFLGLALAEMGWSTEAREILDWISVQADEDLYLPEQLGEDLLFPEDRQSWLVKWGEPANPLLWTHAMYLKLHKTLEAKEAIKNA